MIPKNGTISEGYCPRGGSLVQSDFSPGLSQDASSSYHPREEPILSRRVGNAAISTSEIPGQG
jgi:hypothetical protein